MDKPRIQDDLYNYVNKEWIDNAVIPNDKPATGGFSDLNKYVEELMVDEFKEMSIKENYPNIHLERAIRLYREALNEKKRKRYGIKPVLKTLKKIDKLKDIKSFNHYLKDFVINQINLPFRLSVEIDMKDTSKHCVMIDSPSIILPDTTFYLDEEKKNNILSIWKNMASSILKETKLSEEEQIIYLEDTLKFDEILAKFIKSNEEKSDFSKLYNAYKIRKITNLLKPIKFKKLVNDLFGFTPEVIIVTEPRFINSFNEIFNEETFILYKHWAYVTELIGSCSLLSEELRNLGGIYRRALMGVNQMPDINKFSYTLSSNMYSEPVGLYYGKKYFGQKAKLDIEEMVKEIIDTYKRRIANSDILTPETKNKALIKLSSMGVKMGYPDKIDNIYDQLEFDSNLSLYEIVTSLHKIKYLNTLSKLDKPTDHSLWPIPAHMVNACYNPFANDITFPAAILQKPFYSIEQSRSQNLGGIGTVIGHEISHAFDINGSLFDEHGNLSKWWTKEDIRRFKIKTKKMVKQFDGIELPWGKVNGNFIVSENMADNGGVAVTLDIMSHSENKNFEEYFISFAKLWCMKAKVEFLKTLLAIDVHGPALLRVNMPVRNFEEWYKTFNVTKKDKMYLSPNKRVIIW